jgi:DNA-binding NtrC family response regulator
MSKLNVLTIDDEQRFTEELSEYLQDSGFVSHEAHTGREGMEILSRHAIDLLILDVRLPGISGLDILKNVRTKYPGMEVIIVSAHGDMDTVIKAMRLGAIDYLRKPFRHIDIRIAIERTKKFMLLQREIRRLEEKFSLISKNLEQRIERHFIGQSPQIKEVLDMAITAARYPDTNVLITGESGTGKENIARIIHYDSKRKDHIFCAVNSSAITDSLLESEFFGHKKGSFTGAISDKKGFFEISNDGTLFLDEIADMPHNLQAKMLRAIEEKSITRVGETHQVATNFRIISATNKDPEKLQESSQFRLDLFHRLNTLHIHIPPLRERVEDIEPLLHFFVDDISQKLNKQKPAIDQSVLHALNNYDFPGNVRELKNLCERAIILNKDGTLTIKDFPLNGKRKPAGKAAKKDFNLVENEIRLIREALHANEFNISAAAEKLGVQRMALSRKMKKYNIEVKPSMEHK